MPDFLHILAFIAGALFLVALVLAALYAVESFVGDCILNGYKKIEEYKEKQAKKDDQQKS